jgi:hypothetical protein
VITAVPDDSEVLLSELNELPVSMFTSKYVLDRVPWIFEGDRLAYVDWKQALGEELEVDPCGLVIVGSAATCVSLAPDKGLSRFHDLSDIDVAVISAWHFDVAWKWLRSLAADLNTTGVARDAVNAHRRRYVFDGTIATDLFVAHLPFGGKWVTALARAGGKPPLFGRTVNARLYRDFESLREYQMKGVTRAKELSESDEEPKAI